MPDNWLLITLIVGGVISFMSFISMIICFGDDSDRAQVISSGICVFSVVTTFGLFIFMIWGSCKIDDQPWNLPNGPYKTHDIVALNDSNQVNGRFYCRRGYIEEDLYYQYMMKSGSGYKAAKVKADNSTLYYTDDDYRVEFYKKTKDWLCFYDESYYYEIYIPEGSIAEDYAIDLQ